MKFLFRLAWLVAFCPWLDAQSSVAWVLGDGGIYRTVLNGQNGELSKPQLIAPVNGGSWLAVHPTRRVLYAGYSGGGSAGVVSLTFTPDGNLTEQSRKVIPSGSPTHISVDPLGRSLATAHWGGASVCLAALNPDGSFAAEREVTVMALPFDGPGPGAVQVQSRPHWSRYNIDGTLLFVTDLGGDALWTLRVGPEELTLAVRDKLKLPAGSGPRHLSFHPTKPFAYVNGELDRSISVLGYDQAKGTFRLIESRPTLGPRDIEPAGSTSEVRVHRSGKFVYVGNRGHDSISVFSINESSGKVTPVEREPIRGSWPRSFNLGPNGKWLVAAGQRSNSLASFAIDQESGALTFSQYLATVPGPVRVLFVP